MKSENDSSGTSSPSEATRMTVLSSQEGEEQRPWAMFAFVSKGSEVLCTVFLMSLPLVSVGISNYLFIF